MTPGLERLLHPNRQRAFHLVRHNNLEEPCKLPGASARHAEALAYMRQRNLATHVITRLADHRDRQFSDQNAFSAHLKKLGLTDLKVRPDPVEIATEGALWGSIEAHGLLPRKGLAVSAFPLSVPV
jgi:hypothetical protein